MSDTKTMFEVFRERSMQTITEYGECAALAGATAQDGARMPAVRQSAMADATSYSLAIRAEARHQELIAMHEETRGKLMAILDWIDNS